MNHKQGRRNKPKGGRRRDNILTSYASPSFGMKYQSKIRTTLTAYVQLNTLTGTNGFNQTVNWPAFQGGAQLQDIYRYFEVTGWRVDCTLPTVSATTDSFYSGAAGLLPCNYLIEGINILVPTDQRDVLLLPGSVNIKQGQANKGRWIPSPFKQVFPTSSFVSGGTRLATNLIGYFNDIGVNETPAVIEIYCDIIAYGIQLQIPSITYVQLDPPRIESCEEIEEVKSTRSVSVVKKKPR